MILILVLIFLYSPAANLFAEELTVKLPIISKVTVKGLTTIDEPFIRLSVSSRTGTPLTTSRLRQDEDILRETGLFRTVETETATLPDGTASVRFNLIEAPEVQSINVSGVKKIDLPSIEDYTKKLITGMPDGRKLLILAGEISRRYTEAGYFGCGLRSNKSTELTSDGRLNIFIVEPKLASINIRGNKRVRKLDIRRKLLIPRGKVIRVSDMDDSIRHLSGLGTLAQATFEVDHFSTDESEIYLSLVVQEEKFMGDLEYGVRYESINGASATVNLTRRNFFNEGKTFILQTELGQQINYSARLSSDWILDIPVTGETGIFSTETMREARNGSTVISRLEERRTGYLLGMRKTLPEKVLTELTFRDETIDAQAVEDYLLPDNLASISSNPTYASYDQQCLVLSVSRGPLLKPLTKNEDRSQKLKLETAGGSILDGPGDYTTCEYENRHLFTLDSRHSLALRLRTGGIFLRSGILPYLEQLSIGGGETLRGYLFEEFTGDRLLLANLEFRKKMNPNLKAVLFTDWGDCWAKDERGMDGKLTVGLGALIDVKLFELRIDVGKALDRDGVEVTFGVGHLF
jgi:outer membrane protein assembly factor BamA